MRRTLFLAAVLFAAPAQAATLPVATEPGITVSRNSSGSYLVTFTPRAYKGVAGRSFDIACMSSAARLGGAGAPKRSVKHLGRLPARVSSIRVTPPRGDNVCAFIRGQADVF